MLFTNYAENALADYRRGGGITLPVAWHMAFLSSYDETGGVEVGGMARVALPRSMTSWSATQGQGIVIASNGSSHTTYNNQAIPMGTVVSAGTAVAIGFYDASSSGNMWMVYPLTTPLELDEDDTPSIAQYAMAFTWQGLTDYAANKQIDLVFRGQSFAWPATLYMAGFTVAPTNAGGGTEVGGGSGYARAAIDSTTDAWSATDGPGSTTPSTGTSGTISNNLPVVHPQPTGNQGTWVAGGAFDAPTGGNLMMWNALAEPRTVTADSEPPTWSENTISQTIA
jgi:hypothetical protein